MPSSTNAISFFFFFCILWTICAETAFSIAFILHWLLAKTQQFYSSKQTWPRAKKHASSYLTCSKVTTSALEHRKSQDFLVLIYTLPFSHYILVHSIKICWVSFVLLLRVIPCVFPWGKANIYYNSYVILNYFNHVSFTVNHFLSMFSRRQCLMLFCIVWYVCKL